MARATARDYFSQWVDVDREEIALMGLSVGDRVTVTTPRGFVYVAELRVDEFGVLALFAIEDISPTKPMVH